MSSEISFHLADGMDAALSAIDDCLKQMKKCCEPEIPFHVASEMESTIDVAQDCLKQMRKCFELAKTLTRLESYEKKGSKTKVMLILTPYGSKEKFKDRIFNAITTYGDRLEKLKDCIKEVKAMAQKKNYECPQCQGTGTLFKWVYIRERGTPMQRVYRSYPCDSCGETGQVSIDLAVQGSLNVFLERAGELSITMKNFHTSVRDFTTACCSRPDFDKEPKTPAREEGLTYAPKREEVVTEVHEKPKPKKPSWPYPKGYFLELLNLKRVSSSYYRAPNGTPNWWERRANRQYTCSSCRKLIKKGARYIGSRKLRPGMRGPYGYRGTYIKENYHIVCLLRDAQAKIKGNIRNSDSEMSRLAGEITSLRNEVHLRRQQIKNCETLTQQARKNYEDTSFWRRFGKWVSYKYTSWSKGREISRLEREISEIEDREIPRRETRIANLDKRVSNLDARLSEIKGRIQELTRAQE